MKKTVNWALVGTGGITKRFLTGLRASGFASAEAAVSRTKANADAFASQFGIKKAYSEYDEMLNDKNIDVVYIGTPHSSHRDLTVRALKAKKAVLCEKPAALNAAEVKEMIDAARENNVFFMEAMWNRFTPPLVKVREWLNDGLIGEVKMVQATFGTSAHYDPKNRLFDPAQGGGALLDLGIYPLSLGSMVFGGSKPERIVSQMTLNDAGTDNDTSALLSYGNGRLCQIAVSLSHVMKNDAIIYGTAGHIHIPNHTFAHNAELNCEPRYSYRFESNYVSNGYNYEAEEVNEAVREGRIESPVMSWKESLQLAQIMDEIRSQWNFRYPAEQKQP